MSSPSCTVQYSKAQELITYSLIERTALVKKYVFEVHEILRLYFPGTKKYGRILDDMISDRKENILDTFELRTISVDELKTLRQQTICGFVLKEAGTFYFTQIPKDTRFIYIENYGIHECANCNHMSAQTDKGGGCQKVRIGSSHIEYFEWIKSGYETFNTMQDSFFVSECDHHSHIPKRPSVNKFLKEKLLKDFEDYAMDYLYPDPKPSQKRDPNA